MLFNNQPQNQWRKSKKHLSSSRVSGWAGWVLAGSIHMFALHLLRVTQQLFCQCFIACLGLTAVSWVGVALAGTTGAIICSMYLGLQQVGLGMFSGNQSQGTKTASRHMQRACSSLYLYHVCLYPIGQSQSHGQAQSQRQRGLHKL